MEELLSTVEVPKILGLKPQTLRVMRCHGTGPRYIRYGKLHARVMYRPEDIDTFIKENSFSSTSEETVKKQRKGD